MLTSTALPVYGGDRHRVRWRRLRNWQNYIRDSRTACRTRGIVVLSRHVGLSRSTKRARCCSQTPPLGKKTTSAAAVQTELVLVRKKTHRKKDRRQGLAPASATAALNAAPIASTPPTGDNRASATAAQAHHLRCQALFSAASSREKVGFLSSCRVEDLLPLLQAADHQQAQCSARRLSEQDWRRAGGRSLCPLSLAGVGAGKE